MVDIFEEVEEQLRSARYRTLALKALPWAGALLLAALIAALGVWAYSAQRDRASAKASEAYAAALDHAQAGNLALADTEFDTAAKAGAKGYRALALMQRGALKLKAGDTAAAVALFDQAVAAAPTPLIGDAARLQAVYALMDSAKPVDIQTRLAPMLAADGPYRAQAREALALTKLSQGQGAAARGDFVVLSEGLDTPDGIRQRAQAAIALIDGGGAAAMPAILKASRALPASAAIPPPAPAADAASTPQAGTAQ